MHIIPRDQRPHLEVRRRLRDLLRLHLRARAPLHARAHAPRRRRRDRRALLWAMRPRRLHARRQLRHRRLRRRAHPTVRVLRAVASDGIRRRRSRQPRRRRLHRPRHRPQAQPQRVAGPTGEPRRAPAVGRLGPAGQPLNQSSELFRGAGGQQRCHRQQKQVRGGGGGGVAGVPQPSLELLEAHLQPPARVNGSVECGYTAVETADITFGYENPATSSTRIGGDTRETTT
eukprot:1182874-Prorocentrum_minimum.AAC.2